jgi:hypothetical protein
MIEIFTAVCGKAWHVTRNPASGTVAEWGGNSLFTVLVFH